MQPALRKGLTKAKILKESRTLLDTGGPAALTMRALAERLGVAAMALYNHFHDRDAILDALADSVFEQLRNAGAEAISSPNRRTSWKRKIKAVLLSAQQIAAQHPQIFRVAFTRPNKPASAFALAKDTIQILAEAGLNRRESLTVYHTFVILLHGYPFWQEALAMHTEELCLPMELLPTGTTVDGQFEAIADWLLECISTMTKPKKRLPSHLSAGGGKT